MSGRQQGLVTKSSQSKSRDGQVEFDYDNLVQQHPDSRNKQPLRYQGNLSPNRRTDREREVTGDPQERREYEWHMRNSQGDQVHSRPPPSAGRMEKRPCMDERVLQRNPPRVDNQRGYDYADYEDYNDGQKTYNYAEYEGYNDGFRSPEHAEHEDYNNDRRRYVYAEHEDYNNEGRRYGYVEQEDNNDVCRRYGYVEHEGYNNETIRKSNHVYGYDDSVQVRKELHSDRRFPANNQHGVMTRNVVPGEDGVDQQSARLHQGRGHGQGYGRSSQSHPTLEMQRSKEENDRYQERLPEELYMESSYYEQEKYPPQPRKISHTSTPPQFNDFGNQYLPKGVPSTSSDVIRGHFPGRHQDVDTHPHDGYPRNPGKLSENLGTQEYGQRPQLQPRKDYEGGYADMNCQECDPYGYSWNEHEDYAYANTESRGKDDPGYITHDGLHRGNRAPAQEDFEHRYMQRAAIAKPIAESPTEAEGSHGIYGHNGLRELDNSQKEEIPGYEDVRRPFGTATKEADCLNTGYAPAEFAGRASQDIHHNNQSSVVHEHETSAYDHGRYANVARTQGERVKSSAELVDPEDIQHVERENRYADEQVAFNNRMAKRKYLQDEGARGFSLGAKASRKWSTYNGRQQIEDCRPEWNNNTSSSGLHSRGPSGRAPNLFLEAKDVMDEIYHCKDSVRYGLLDQGKFETVQEQSMKSFQPGRKYMKVHSKPESSKVHGRPHYVNHRSDRYNYKQHYVGKRGEYGNHMDVVAQDHNLSEDPKGPPKYGPDENSEGFKQSVLAAFLMFSKKLNEKPPTRKLYKEHGDSGTLFCIVCGRSSSKVFRDTEGLVKHAFMARKATLRAQHLGLHRAICVLMGWDTEVPQDIVKWVPLALSKPEAMAQKEDLIVWQPTIIVHNISLSNNNHKEWKVISLEALEGIVRAKSFIKSRVKICLGYPGDQSVMLVKFLGTFTGLQEAEKLHKYFADKGRGRADFDQAISDMNKNKNDDPSQSSAQEETDEESLLYGYMGIADDLDRIDLDTKKRCKIQSKREIQVIADAPLTRG